MKTPLNEKIKIKYMIKDLIAFQKLEDLTLAFYPVLTMFPKGEQFALAGDIKKEIYSISRLLIEINNTKQGRQNYYVLLNEEFDFLLYLIRLSNKLRFLSNKQYMRISEMIDEVVKICCG